MKIYKIIVIYNNFIKSISIRNIDNIVFVDNSTDKSIKKSNNLYANESFNKFVYIDMQGNKGISRAYNKAIEIIKPTNDDYILILDQDTDFDSNIFNKYIAYIESNPSVDIICPIVKDSEGIMSPSLSNGVYNYHIQSVNEVKDDKINEYSFINSGMCIKGSVFSKLKYDETLFLDFVDHDFVKQIKENNFIIGFCFDVVLNQDFSGVTKNTFEQDFNRFKIFIKDAKVYYNKYFPKQNYKIILFKRTLKLTFIHRKLSFFTELIRLK